MAVSVKIGGQDYDLAPLKFKQLKKAYPLILDNQRLNEEAKAKTAEMHASGELPEDQSVRVNPIEAMGNAIAILAIALEKTHPQLTLDKIEEDISLEECAGLNDTIIALITESGFEVAKPGEGAAEEGAASPSTETLTA